MIVNVRRDGLSISVPAELLGFSHTRIEPLEFSQNGAKNKKHPVSGSFADKNAMFIREVNGDWPEWFEFTRRQQ